MDLATEIFDLVREGKIKLRINRPSRQAAPFWTCKLKKTRRCWRSVREKKPSGSAT
jgi:poly(3-hydroxyalkanoate) synthetase